MNLQQKLLNRIPVEFRPIVEDAIEYANSNNADEKRLCGETYLEHNIQVAMLALDIGLDVQSVLIAILHHVFSIMGKAELTSQEVKIIKNIISQKFGDEVLELLQLMENISNVTQLTSERQALTKYILKDCKDLRVIMVRLCDKLHNARSIEYLPRERQLSYSEKLLKIYSPLAEYLNLSEFKNEYEAIAFKTTLPEEYERIDSYLEEQRVKNEKIVRLINDHLRKCINKEISDASVYGRIKGHYSIYRKLKKYKQEGKDTNLYKIKDILAFSILVTDVKDCYKSLSVLQSDQKINIFEVEDYILSPKPNGYKSMHLLLEMEIPELDDIMELELQIKTFEMYHMNTYGSASHFAYKMQGLRFSPPSKDFEWVKDIHEKVAYLEHDRSITLSNPIISKVFSDQVFVFTPKGDIVDLPNGASVVDFAFAIHSDLGLKMINAKVNDKLVAMDHQLNDGDTVEILTSKNPSARSKVSDNWLEYAITDRARRRIIKVLTERYK